MRAGFVCFEFFEGLFPVEEPLVHKWGIIICFKEVVAMGLKASEAKTGIFSYIIMEPWKFIKPLSLKLPSMIAVNTNGKRDVAGLAEGDSSDSGAGDRCRCRRRRRCRWCRCRRRCKSDGCLVHSLLM